MYTKISMSSSIRCTYISVFENLTLKYNQNDVFNQLLFVSMLEKIYTRFEQVLYKQQKISIRCITVYRFKMENYKQKKIVSYSFL